jgi:hypothetical protein
MGILAIGPPEPGDKDNRDYLGELDTVTCIHTAVNERCKRRILQNYAIRAYRRRSVSDVVEICVKGDSTTEKVFPVWFDADHI